MRAGVVIYVAPILVVAAIGAAIVYPHIAHRNACMMATECKANIAAIVSASTEYCIRNGRYSDKPTDLLPYFKVKPDRIPTCPLDGRSYEISVDNDLHSEFGDGQGPYSGY